MRLSRAGLQHDAASREIAHGDFADADSAHVGAIFEGRLCVAEASRCNILAGAAPDTG